MIWFCSFIKKGNNLRFAANGPSIPNELLRARDEGRVVFFCGAGISRARANLPDFFGLAQSVVSKLGVDQSSPACKLIQEAQEIDRRVGVSGIISADRVFGLLERDFASRDIEEAVASALKPLPNCDLTAHKILLDLATTSEGMVQLVTTNFDRLFDDCERQLQAWQPPRLPDPLRSKEINGIVYLHGRANAEYTGAEGDGFVLSSSEFGRAYLSDGWATSFIREILGKYVVVFVGYTADDPPVQYLLEALRKASGKLEKAYAFQAGDYDDAVARWLHKGVEAIPYSEENKHAALWQSLEAWAARARDPDAWYEAVIEVSKKGPAVLQPYERGQVAHVVSTYDGVKRFCIGETLPPAEWVCVFDRYRRFAKPGYTGSFGDKGTYTDPFDLYGLDSDSPPNKSDPEDYYAKRETPLDAWDAFELNRLDRSTIQDDNLAALRGHWATHSPRLVPRVGQLGVWLAKVCDQPAAVWWAAHQLSIHQTIQEQISWELERSNRPISKDIRHAWQSMFEAWEYTENFYRDWYAFQAVLKIDGWSTALVRRFGEVFRPHLSSKPDFFGGPNPPMQNDGERSGSRLMRMDVSYPEGFETIDIPDEWCAAIVRVLRQNLELALALENEIGGYGLSNISPIDWNSTDDSDNYSRTHGLSGAVIQFTKFFLQLSIENKIAAKHEFQSWSQNDDTIFARLRIWASGNRSVVSDRDFGQVIKSLSDTAFWNSYHQRDLLLVLAGRWPKLKNSTRKLIEQRLLNGRKKWRREKISEFTERRAWLTLDRIQWLMNSGCKFSRDIDKKMKPLHEAAPKWKSEYSAQAAESREARAGWVKTDTNHEGLSNTAISSLLARAKELGGRSSDFLVENDPFAGLSAERPARAFAALTHAAKRGDFPQWAWRSFLNSEGRKTDKPKFSRLIGERLASYPDEQLATIVRPASDWLRDSSAKLKADCISTFDLILQKLTDALQKCPSEGQSGVVRGSNEPDWTMEAINSPAGRIAEALFYDPRHKNLDVNQGLPLMWVRHVEALLMLPDDLRRYTLVILFRNLNWFYAIDPKWTGQHLLPVLHCAEMANRDAAWAGFLWGARTPNRKLYMLLKQQLLDFAVTPLSARRSYGETIAGIILAGWGSVDETNGERCVSDDEMRSLLLKVDDEFRSRILWQAQTWSSEKNENSHERWAGQLSELLRIWPRQMSARSANTSARLCELAFSSGEQFPEIADLVLPLLVKIERDHLRMPELRRSGKNVVDEYPVQALALLHAALPDNALAWPYGIEATLQRIGEADSSLNSDERLIALRRRWDAR
ncbi:MAG: SIR2 family protein [Rhabdaerophilum sp.]